MASRPTAAAGVHLYHELPIVETDESLASDNSLDALRLQVASDEKSRGDARRRARSTRGDPTLGVSHVLVWLTLVSVYFGVTRVFAQGAAIGSLGLLILVSQAMLAGLCWSGLLLVTWRTIRGIPLPSEPGHWLLAALGVRLTAELLLRFDSGTWFASQQAVIFACTCCALILPTLSRRVPPIWKVVFGLLFLGYAWPLLIACEAIWLENPILARAPPVAERWLWMCLGRLPPLGLTLVTVWRGHRPHWLQWVGVLTWTCGV